MVTPDWAALLATCDAEQLHLSNAIQPHGYLVHLALPGRRVLHASANLLAHLRLPMAEVLGQPALPWLGDLNPEPLLAPQKAGIRQRVAAPVRVGNQDLLAQASRTAQGCLVELHPAGPPGETLPSRASWAGFGDLETTTEQCELAVTEVQRVTGFDRVMMYRFTDDWSGEVVAESLTEGMDGFLGLRFPASDIPQVARNLFTLNPARMIADVDYTPVPIVAATPETGPLDLTRSDLRSVSPVHIQYLRNMEVRTSFSVSVLVRGRLWGMIACHHRTPRLVSLARRERCIEIAQILSVHVSLGDAQHHMRIIDAADRRIEELLASVGRSATVAAGILEHEREVLSLVGATGGAFVQGDRCVLLGSTPAEAQVRALARWCFAHRRDFFSTDHLAEAYVAGAEFADVGSGLLALQRPPSLRRSELGFLWFRPEVARTVRWAGNREKGIAVVEGKEILTPRKSFAAWTEIKRQHSEPWSRLEILTAQKFRSLVLRWAEA